MRRSRTVGIGVGLAAAAVGLVSAACIGAAPPSSASLAMSPSPAIFPSVPPPYSPMPIVPVTVTNTGGHAARGIALNGAGVYSVPSSSCSTLAPGQSCVADIQFCPTSPGNYTNSLLVTGQDAVTGSPLQATTMLEGVAT
jgi:hypothetical protein